MKPDFYIDCLEPEADNPKEHAPVPAPEPPEGFVDNTVYRYKLVDGKEVLIGTMEAFPEGWGNPRAILPQKPKKEEESIMNKKDLENLVLTVLIALTCPLVLPLIIEEVQLERR